MFPAEQISTIPARQRVLSGGFFYGCEPCFLFLDPSDLHDPECRSGEFARPRLPAWKSPISSSWKNRSFFQDLLINRSAQITLVWLRTVMIVLMVRKNAFLPLLLILSFSWHFYQVILPMSKRRNPRKRSLFASSRQLRHEALERRELLAAEFGDYLQQPERAGDPMLIAVSPNNGELLDLDPQDMSANRRMTAPKAMNIFIGGEQPLDETTFRGAFQLQYQREGNFGAADVEDVVIGVIDPDDSGRGLAIRFADNLKDGFFQLSITTQLQDITGVSYVPRSPVPVPGDATGSLRRDVISFEVETGAKITGVVPQPLSGGAQSLNTIDVYFDDADLFDSGSTVAQPSFYQLIDTNNTVTTEDDVIHIPSSVTTDSASARVSLLFNSDLADLVGDVGDSLRLRIGDNDLVSGSTAEVLNESVPVEPGLSAGGAHEVTSVSPGDERWSFMLQQTIVNAGSGLVSMVDNPGGINEPGHRDIELSGESHFAVHGDRDQDNEILEIAYTFLRDQPYGVNSQGQPVYNEMDADQEARFREILEVYGEVMGVDFVETESDGLQLLVGDLSIAGTGFVSGEGLSGAPGSFGVGTPDKVVMDAVDFRTPQLNAFGELFFDVAVHEIGHALGLGNAYDLPPGTTNGGGNPPAYPGGGGLYPDSEELTFPGPADRIHVNYLDQRESLDVDLYQIEIGQDGILKAQTFAARLAEASRLDTRLSLFLKDPDTERLELVAANDDFFSSDSYVEIAVSPNPDGSPAAYFVGVSAEGNALFDPDTGLPSPGGASQGEYELRVDFVADIALTTAITDGSGSVLDGDRDGVAGGNYNFWFEPSIDDSALSSVGNTIFVNKDAAVGGNGTLASPFNNIPMALNRAESLVSTANPEGVVVKLLPSVGPDGDVATVGDNVAYEVGLITSIGQVLEDGRNLELPGGVQLVVDAGVIMKFLDSRISVGSDNDGFDRSQSSISVQGTPELPVRFTSYNDTNLGSNSNVLGFAANAGDWGGIEIRNDVDRDQGRIDLEREGVFQNYINHASFQYGGGEVSSIGRVIAPIHLSGARAEISYNTLRLSSDAPISADPNTFELTTFTEPRYQNNRQSDFGFIADYSRVGPFVHGNQLKDNPTNGIFVRIDTPPGGGLETLQVPARFDDVDIVHVLAENFILEGVPGGLLQDSKTPDSVVGLISIPGGDLASGDYAYTYTFVDAFGYESPNSEPQHVALSVNSNVQLADIPVATGKYVGRKLYRSFDRGPFQLVADLDRTSLDHLDDVAVPAVSAAELLVPSALSAAEDAGAGSLTAGTYTYKYTFVDSSGIESRYSLETAVSVSANKNVVLTGIESAAGKYVGRNLYRSDNGGAFRLVAELDQATVTHTDDNTNPGALAADTAIRHGRIASTLVIDPGMIIKAQGARIELGFGANLLAEGRDGDEIIFTSKADDRYGASGSFDTDGNGVTLGERGDWGGFYAKPTSRLSIDEAFIAHAGGVTGVNGGTASFNAVQVHQAATRITNTRFEDNASGTGSQQGDGRTGYAPQGDATVYINSTQPTLINNVFVDNDGAAISINTNAMGHEWKDDAGRQIGGLGAFEVSAANNGPVIQGNRLSGNDLNGLEVRAEVLQTAVVWDDTDIAHVLNGTIIVPDHHTYGGLRLESSSGEALVVKVLAGGGIEATGRSLDIDDRIGGRVHVIGQPGFPVIMTSINDTSVGAGFTPEGRVQKETRPGGGAAQSGDWQGLSFDPYSNDRNVAVHTEIEGNIGGFGDANAFLGVEESVGLLAANEKSGDENLRLGFKIHGAIAADRDVDLFSFEGAAGSMVWIDIDETDPRLDTILELIDGAGRVLAVSQNSREESNQGELAFVNDDLLRDGHALPMQLDHDAPENADGSYRDLYTTNDGDSGMRVVLPGVTGTRNDFFVRVRSNNLDSNIGGFQMSYSGVAAVAVGDEVVGLISGAKGVVTKVDSIAGTLTYVLKTQMQFSTGEDLVSHPGNGVNGVSSLIADGATRGSYQLQLRLREVDEFAGSVVRYADLRYATDAIVATGLPAHSPLTGELTHLGPGLSLGNFSNTDRGAVSTAGFLASINDQDYYGFTIARDPLATDGNEAVSVSLDIDWADGLTRPDTAIYGLRENEDGTFSLISRGNDSNIADDIITPIVPGQATTQDDLSRGSQGTRDALVGPMKLPPGNYCIVVAHDGKMDVRLTQFTQFNAPAGLDPAAWAATRVQPLANTETLDLTPNRIDFQFGDIPFLIVPPAANADILVANPFTGRHDATIDTEARDSYGGVAASEQRFEVLAIEATNGSDAGSDQVYTIDTEGLESPLGETGIQTFRTNGTTNEQQNVGIRWRAMSFAGQDDQRLYALGDRAAFDGGTLDANSAINGSVPRAAIDNLIYLLDPETGAAVGRNGVTLNDGFQSVNPLNPLHPNFGSFGPADIATPWAGTNVVAQVEAPEDIVSLVGLGNSLYAFGVSGTYYRYLIQGDGDLVQVPAQTLVAPQALNGTPGGLRFASVTRGPHEFGIGNLFFGIEQGTSRMYAFAPGGAAQPIMEFGREFADLDPSLVNIADAANVAGMFFGHFQTSWQGGSLVGQTNPVNGNDFDFLGGGHGSVQLDPIDLSGFGADDLPTFYFDYRLHSDDRNDVNPNTVLVPGGASDDPADTLRVSIAGDDGVWRMVATNNMTDGPAGRVWQTGGSATTTGGPSPNAPVEYDPAGSRGYTNVFTQTFVQELFDDSVDRQARIDLGPWAGDENVQIRIDFTTAGEARPDQTEINLLPGYQVADGHQLTLTGRMPNGDQHDPLTAPTATETFEFEHGLLVDLPAGAAVTEKVTLRSGPDTILTLLPDDGDPLTNGNPANRELEVSTSDSAADVADKVQELLALELPAAFPALTLTLHRSSERPGWLQIKGLPSGTVSFSGGSLNFGDKILGEPGVSAGSTAIEIGIDVEWAKERVAEQVQEVFADTIKFNDVSAANGLRLDSFPLVEGQNGNIGSLRVYDLIVEQSGAVPSHAKPFTMIHGQYVDPAPFDSTTDYPGEEFGVYGNNPNELFAGQRSKGVGGGSTSQAPAPTTKQGMGLGNYQFGLAERGERVSSAITTGNTLTLVDDPFFEALYQSVSGNRPVAQEVESGPYQFEVRLARQTVDANPVLFNERLADGFNLQVDSAGSDIVDGDVFTLSNGYETITFEFNDLTGTNDGVTPGNVEVPYLRTFSGGQLADAIRSAVNLGEVRDVLKVQATSQGGRLNDPSDPVVFFHGFAAADNLGGIFFESSNADLGSYVGLLDEKFEHNKISSAQNLNAGIWSEVAGVPTLSIDGTRDDSEVDYYSFNVGSVGVTGAFEVDTNGFDPQLFLLESDGDLLNFGSDSMTHTFNESGTYFLAVARVLPAGATILNQTFPVPASTLFGTPDEPVSYGPGFPQPAGPDDLYELNIGLENKSRHFSSIITGQDVGPGFDNGDRNRFRDQGVFIVDSNVVSFSSGDGVTIAAAPTASGPRVPAEGARPKPGSSQNLPLLNAENEIYGAVVENNLLIGNNRGIVLDGDLGMNGPNIHSRLMNNTVFNSNGAGIDILDGAAPTLLNNVLIENGIGVRGQNEGETVLRSTVFADNNVDVVGLGKGTEQQTIPSGQALFVNPDATGFNLAAGRPNFYPSDGSAVIDQSIASQPDRNNLVSIKDVIGIPPSPIVVSDRDLVGQLRENGSTSSGQGQNVNIDIGAIDRSDVTGPLATLMIPGDNDGDGIDIDPANTILQLKSGTYGFFEILISEGAGIGPDESSIDSERVMLVENRRRLVPDTEVVISYNSANRTLRFQSPAGLWRPDAVYEILLLNEALTLQDGTTRTPVADLAGNPLQPNRPDGQSRFTIVMPEVGIDFGDAYQSTTFADYATTREQDGARHAIIDTYDPTTQEYHLAEPRLGRYVDDDYFDSKSQSQMLVVDPSNPGELIGDDLVVTLTVDGNEQDPSSDGPFTITGLPGTDGTEVEIDPAATVQPGDNLSISAAHSFVAGSDVLGQEKLVYELVTTGSQASANRIPVEIDPADSTAEVMGKLAATLDAELAARNLQVSVVYTSGSNSILLLPHDDEDGVPIGTFQGGAEDYLVFGETIVDDVDELLTSEVTGFLNPLDDSGTYFDVTVTGTGFLRAWVDFDDDGVFEADELVVDDESFTNAAAGVETRRLKIDTPSDALAGRRWMRYRFSQDESVLPTGLVVGGETEDYQIDVIRMVLPTANPDLFTILEDGILDTSNLPAGEEPIDSNDDDIPDEDELPVDVEFVIGEMPEFGTLDLETLDFLQTGNFIYDSNDDFNGIDTFTYRITTQDSRSDDANGDFSSDYTTVTIDVLPLNDKPDASASFVTGQEDRSMVITQDDLLEAADPDNESPGPFVLPAGSTTLEDRDVDLMNEANQQFVISAVQGNGTELITRTTPATTKGTGANDLSNLEILENGGGITITVNDSQVGDVFSLAYAGKSATFELLDANNPEPKDGTVSVFVDSTSDAAAIANRLSTKIADAFAGSDPAIDIAIDALTPNTLELSFATPTVDVTASGATFGGMQVADEVNVVAGPLSGDTVSLQLGSETIVFEFIVEGESAASGNVGVALLPFESSGDAARAAAAHSLKQSMNQEFKSRNWGVAASIADPIAEPNKITISETAITAGRSLSTARGEAIALFDHAGALIELYYIGKLDYNRDNNSPSLGGDAQNFDSLSFVATDDGISIDLQNNRFVYGVPKTADLATADIEIKPLNDVPVVNADGNDDRVAMELDTLDPTVSNMTTPWESYFMGLGETVPVPTEDEPLVIPSDFLILNDLRARDSAQDENIDSSEADNNDAGMRVSAAIPQWDPQFGGSVTVDPVTGDVTLVPPTDWYGDVSFKYTIVDEGINESIDGTRVDAPLVSPLSEAGLVTVSLQPVNDIPVAHDREMRFTETGADVADEFVFTADDLIDPVLVAPTGPGVVGPVPLVANTPHANTLGLPTPFNEAEQQMRVVEFSNANGDTVGVVDLLTGEGNEELTLDSNTGGRYVLSFTDSVFTSGKFIPSPNYNERTPFDATDGFTYRIMDDGQADASELNGQGYTDFDQLDEISALPQPGVSEPAEVTISVTKTNDAPGFDIPNLTLDILERDDQLGTVVENFAENILPGPVTAIDETTHQNVSFSVTLDSSTPSNLIQSAALSPTGDLTVITFPDAVGQATLIVTATDAANDSSEPFVARTTVEQITINVRPVNDAPRLKEVLPDSDENPGSMGPHGLDEAWSVSADPQSRGEITYTLREDNTQSGGIPQGYNIPVVGTTGPGYQQLGLLDVFTVGVDNESTDVLPWVAVTSPASNGLSIDQQNGYAAIEVDDVEDVVGDVFVLSYNGTARTFTFYNSDNTEPNNGFINIGVDINNDTPETIANSIQQSVFAAFETEFPVMSLEVDANKVTAGPAFNTASLQQIRLNPGGFGIASTNNPAIIKTDRGGTLQANFDDPNNATLITSLTYTPLKDFNYDIYGSDSFSYDVIDDSPYGETYDLDDSDLVPDRLISTNRVILNLNPVNDRPEFQVQDMVVQERGIDIETITDNAGSAQMKFGEDHGLVAGDSFVVSGVSDSAYDVLHTVSSVADSITVVTNVSYISDATGGQAQVTFDTVALALTEDYGYYTGTSFASGVVGGPVSTAFDELSQIVNFELELESPDPAVEAFPASYPANSVASDFFAQTPSIDQSGSLSFEANPDVFGEFIFKVQLVDDEDAGIDRGDLNTSEPVFLTINILAVNDPPIEDPSVDLDQLTREDVPFEIDADELLSAFFPGPSNESNQDLGFAPEEFPKQSEQGGLLEYNRNNAGDIEGLSYTPPRDFNGEDVFSYTVVDNGQSGTTVGGLNANPRMSVKNVTVTIGAVNDIPRFSGVLDQVHDENEAGIAIENWATNVLAGPLTAADEIELQTLEFKFTSIGPVDDIFSVSPTAVIDPVTATASLHYELKQDAFGQASFSVILEDSGPGSQANGDKRISHPPRTFTVYVNNVNNPPTFSLDQGLVSVAEDSGLQTVQVISDISAGPANEMQTVDFEVVPQNVDETFFLIQPTISDTGHLRFRTSENANTGGAGPVVLQVVATDSGGASGEPVEILLEVNPVNDRPEANDDLLADIDEDQLLIIPEASLLGNDVDVDVDDTMTLQLASNVSVLDAQLSFNSGNAEVTYDPSQSSLIQALNEGQFLEDSFEYSVVDAGGLTSELATVSFRVYGVNDAPVGVPDVAEINQNNRAVIDVLQNDSDIDGSIDEQSVLIERGAAFGTLTVNNDGIINYRSFGPLRGNDTFFYSVADDQGARSESILVTILGNLPPDTKDDVAVTAQSTPVMIPILSNDSDPDGSINTQSVSIAFTPNYGTAAIQSDGQVLYTPSESYVGLDYFQYTVLDDDGRESGVATVTVQVNATSSAMQNASNKFDVNADNAVTPIDPLLILNALARLGVSSFPVPENPVVPDYLDVNGDERISIQDVKAVLDELGRIESGSGEGEEATQTVPLTQWYANANVIQISAGSIQSEDLADANKIMLPNCVPMIKEDVIDLLAADQDDRSEDDGSEKDDFELIDEVLADIF
jgi:parallel beta-helix repeat protein/VCBS repeat-containing protein